MAIKSTGNYKKNIPKREFEWGTYLKIWEIMIQEVFHGFLRFFQTQVTSPRERNSAISP
jgi:hypothetical protein